MAMRSLVEPECGRPNPLMQLTNRVGQDATMSGRFAPFMPSTSRSQLGDAFTQEYLNEVSARSAAPTSFSMQQMLRQLPSQRSNAASGASRQLAQNWSQEFAASRPSHADWTAEYVRSAPVQQALLNSAWNDAQSSSTSNLMAQQMGPQSMMWSAEYLDNFDQGVAGSAKHVEATANQWTDEFMTKMEDGAKESYWHNLETEWDNLARADPEHEWLTNVQTTDIYKDYNLQEENPFLDVTNPLEEGIRLWAQGDLANAILHFEAAVQKDPQNSEAWRYLGSTQAENEQEPSAIAALRKSLDLNPSNLDALFSLAVAYTNESMENDALSTLERWLAANPAYQGVIESSNINFRRPNVSSFLDRQYFGELENKFLEAAQRQPAGVDSTLQNALAVLYNLNGNFDRAVDSLQAALKIKPEDARLWNRLGATLANSDRPAEAVAAYSRALDLYPAYVRARYNLGISCMNLKSNREAVEHFLSALQLQQRGIGPDSRQQISDGIWQTMRSAVMRMERSDELLRAAEGKNVADFARVFHQIAPSNMSSMAQHDQLN